MANSLLSHLLTATLSGTAPAAESLEILGLSSHLARLHVRVIPDLDCPAVVGLTRQTILLPTNYRSASQGALSSALAHEMAHLRHKDLAWTLLAELVKAIFWFDPVAWAACRELRFESEVAADQLALTWTQSSPKAYAEHLQEWLNPGPCHPLSPRGDCQHYRNLQGPQLC